MNEACILHSPPYPAKAARLAYGGCQRRVVRISGSGSAAIRHAEAIDKDAKMTLACANSTLSRLVPLAFSSLELFNREVIWSRPCQAGLPFECSLPGTSSCKAGRQFSQILSCNTPSLSAYPQPATLTSGSFRRSFQEIIIQTRRTASGPSSHAR